ncbi:MAG: TIGR01244 family phosphatase [Rhizobiaceae bacterium]|nr:TIGR01244 family phosphatase [Rhizobiaceae bacterium]
MSIRPVDPNFHVTGQMSPAQMKEVAGLGYRTVICMRPDKEGFSQPAFSEMAEAARSAGIEAFYIPVTPGAMTVEQAHELRRILAGREGPTLAYCASGNRCISAYEMSKRV